MIGRGGLDVRIDVGIGPRVLNCVIGELPGSFDCYSVHAAPVSRQTSQLQQLAPEAVS
jgi:hypothetical protein